MNVVCVCGFCGYRPKEDDNATIEINFRDAAIYFVCPQKDCHKINKLILQPPKVPLPYSKLA